MTNRTLRIARAAFVLLAAVILIGALSPVSAATNNIGVDIIPLNLKNSSKNNKNLYVYIAGMSGGDWYYVSDTSGNVTQFTPKSTPTSYGINVGKVKKVKIKLPQLTGMRIYFSYAKPLLITVSSEAIPGVPAGWVTSDPNYNTLFDWAEFTWVPDGNTNSTLGGNATQVDMFGFAMKLRLAGLEGDFTTKVVKKSGFAKHAARKKIFSTIKKAKRSGKNGASWKKLIMRANNGKPLRVIAPYHGMDQGLFPTNQLQKYIDAVYTHYTLGKTISVAPQGVNFKGKTVGGNLVFTQVGNSANTFQFPKPDSDAVYKGSILPVPMPTNTILQQQALAVGALLQGSFLRTTLLIQPNLDACKRAQFYKKKPVNIYAKAIHQQAIGKLAYAFGFDDTCNQSSYIGVNNPKSLVITLLPTKT